MSFFDPPKNPPCFYCKIYQKVYPDYPDNESLDSRLGMQDMVPRCALHAGYICDTCGTPTHFNGISYCPNCDTFTCVRCGEERMVEEAFLVYDYYYSIKCTNCGVEHPALDYAEYAMQHPFQIGARRPSVPLILWIPMLTEIEDDNVRIAGRNRLIKATEIKYGVTADSVDVWDKLSDIWGKNWPEDGDVNHKYIIIPAVMDLLLPQASERILDVGCGTGTLSRMLARQGVIVTGVDPSQMLNYALDKEQAHLLGITYNRIKMEELLNQFSANSFDKVVANMVLMDVPDLDVALSNIYSVLRSGGIFVLSIVHPCFGFPTTQSVKIPHDSERNEDRMFAADNYFNEGGFAYDVPNMHMVQYHRMMSTYVTTFIKNGFTIDAMREPAITDELAIQHPRDFLNDYDRLPKFLVIRLKK